MLISYTDGASKGFGDIHFNMDCVGQTKSSKGLIIADFSLINAIWCFDVLVQAKHH